MNIMEQRDKDLLFVDLCGRVSYDTVFFNPPKRPSEKAFNFTLKGCEINTFGQYVINKWFPIDGVRPYLRPMQSMTADEEKEYNHIKYSGNEWELTDWLNAHHFDYRGLIEKGLAIGVTKEMDIYE